MRKALIFFLFVSQLQAYTIIIDPGHGGSDQGAIAPLERINRKGERYVSYIYEKDLDLSLAKRIVKKLKKKRYRVFLTRSHDRNVTLAERAALADKLQADLFISIHFNSSTLKKSSGFESYYLDNHNDAAVRKVEGLENMSLGGEDLIVHQIVTDLVIKQTVKVSKSLSISIHREIKKRVAKKFKMHDRKVKAGLFYVLALSKIPGVLLEVGFISNPEELKRITKKKFQEAYANGVVSGIDKFLTSQNKRKPMLF